MKKLSFILIIKLIILQPLLSCTVVMVSDNNQVLFGNNEDASNPYTRIWFIPSNGNEFGRVCYGFDDKLEYPFCQGGMNDQGLCIDGTRVPNTAWKRNEKLLDFDSGKPLFGNLSNYILANFSTVDEVIEFFRTHNVDYLKKVKFPIADKSGNMAVIEWGENGLEVIKKESGYLIATNFVQSEYDKYGFPIPRYEISEQILEVTNHYSIDVIRSVLSATHSETGGGTQYSTILDPKTGTIYLYNFRNFESVKVFDLHKELKKGKKSYSITTLFPTVSNAHLSYLEEAFIYNLRTYINSNETDNSYQKEYLRLKDVYETTFNSKIRLSESALNRFGYQYMRMEDFNKAIGIFLIMIAEYPKSANAFDSLGEAYMKNGDKEFAIKNYTKSLELNPENDNAIEMLNELE